MKMLKTVLFWLSMAWAVATFAAVEPLQFASPQDEARYRTLTEELRCLVCQNQNLADSNADLAKDLRRETYKMVNEGKSNPEIVEFMVDRYGDFVLYRPPVKSTTLLLWFGPLILVGAGLVVLFLQIRKRKARVHTDDELTAEEQARLDSLLQTKTNPRNS